MAFKQHKNSILFFSCLILLTACSPLRKSFTSERLVVAKEIFADHCKNSGEKIYKTASNVEGIFLIKLRAENINFNNQFLLDDPYGRDLIGSEGYIVSFLDGIFNKTKISNPKSEAPVRSGYSYVEAFDPVDKKLYRYTGAIEEPWEKNKSYLKGFLRFRLDKQLSEHRTSKYGVTFEDISSLKDREYWIAGSSLKIIDLLTGETIAERIGYMIDLGQGNMNSGRSPWLMAANNACPSFFNQPRTSQSGPASLAQTYQSAIFAEKVLHPK